MSGSLLDRESVSGKTLNQYLQNRDFKYPDEAVHLMFSANRWEMKEEILKDLAAGTTLICDRYAFSGVAYSAAKVSIFIINFCRGWTSTGARCPTGAW